MKRNKSLDRKKAISLIVLMITIIIIVIIATTGVILVAKSGIFHSSTELTFKNDMSQYSDRIKNYFGSKVSDGDENIRISGEDLVEYIPELKDSKYLDKLYVLDGELVIDGSKITEDEKNWAKEIGIHVSDSLEIIALDVATTENTIEIKSINTSGDIPKGVKYKFKLDDNEKESTTSSYTFGKLESGKYYLINVSILSNDGQELASYKKNIKTRINNDVVDIKLSTENWTKGPIKVTLEYENIPQAYKIQYKIGKEEYKDYTKEFEVTENNTFIYARLYNKDVGRDTSNNYVEIKNIDKEVPLKPTAISATSGINSIKVRASGSQDSLSGILGYKYSLDGITYTSTIKAYEDYTFTNINADTIKTIYTKAVDNVGNESEVYSKDWSTWEASEKVKISIDPAEDLWTNKAVTVSLSHQSIPTNYIMQYRINNGSWTDGYTAKVTENRTKIEARLYNKNLNDEIGLNSLTIGNIDKIAPNVISAEFNPTKNTIEVSNIVAKDEGGSGIANYELSIKKHSDIYYTPYTSEQNKYTFEGLVKDTLYDIHIRVYDKAGNVSDYYSKSIPTVCTITLDSQGADSGKEGTKTIYEKYEKGFYDTEDCTNKITSISIPKKTGFVFDGYYTEKNGKGTKMIDGAGNITSNLKNSYYTSAGTLYANWVAKKITVIFMRNTTADDTTSDTQEFTYGVTGQSFSAKGWTKKGYTLLGWHEDKNSTAKRYSITSGVQDTWIESKYDASSNHIVTLYAIWQPNTYTVKYNGNGATGGTTANSSHTYDVDKKLTKNGYTRAYTVTYNHNYTGSTNTTKTATYSFVNWNTAANGTGTSYVNEATVKNLTSVNNGVVNLYAIWKSASINYVPTRTGYVFDGWFEDANCTKRATSSNGVYTPTANKTLYAKWTEKYILITYYSNGATEVGSEKTAGLSSDKKTSTKTTTVTWTDRNRHKNSDGTYGEGVNLWNCTSLFSREGYAIPSDAEAWLYNSATSTTYINQATQNFTDYFDNGVETKIDLYANWQLINYTISYNLNQGSFSSQPPTKYNVNSNTVTLLTPTRAGYIFDGWTGSNGTTKQKTVTIPKGSTGNKKYTANWTKAYYQNTSSKKYYVTLNDAFSDAASGNTINVIDNATETKSATLASEKGLTLNMNSKNITFNGAYGITNNGTLNLVGSGKISGSKAHVIHNIGILNIATCTITNTTNGSTRAIWNDYNGTVNMSSGTVSNSVTDVDIKSSGDITPFAIANGGTFNFTGGTIRSNSSGNERQYGILTAGIFIMSGGKIETCGTAIYMKDKDKNTKNKGTNITGGIISNTSARVAINNNSNGTLTISGNNTISITSTASKGIYLTGPGKVNITAPNLTVSGDTNAISNKDTGTITISGAATFTATKYACVENEGTGSISIGAGTFNGKTYGINNKSTGTITVTSGTIEASGGTGISIGSGTLTLGNNSTSVSTTNPSITGSSIGIEGGSIKAFNFYDGVIISNGSNGTALHITATKTPTNYTVQKDDNGKKAYLRKNRSTLTIDPNGGSVNIYDPSTSASYTTVTSSKSYTRNYDSKIKLSVPTKRNASDTENYTVTYDYAGATGGNSTKASSSAKTTVTKYTFNSWSGQGATAASITKGTENGTTYYYYTFPKTEAATSKYIATYSQTQTSTYSSVTLPKPTKTGYSFSGWMSQSGVNVGNGGDKYTPKGDLTLHANWSIHKSTLKINPNGGSVKVWSPSSASSSVTIKTSTSYTQNYNTKLKCEATKGNTTSSTDYKVTFNYGIGSGSVQSSTATKTITYSYTFDSWTKSSTFYGSISNTGNNQTVYTFPSNNNVTSTLTAKYNSTSSSTVNGSVYLPMPNSKSGYTFQGWYTAASGGTRVGGAGKSYTVTSDKTLYAHWSNNKHTHSSGGDELLTAIPKGGNYKNYVIRNYHWNGTWTCTAGHKHTASTSKKGYYIACIYCGKSFYDLGMPASDGRWWCPTDANSKTHLNLPTN